MAHVPSDSLTERIVNFATQQATVTDAACLGGQVPLGLHFATLLGMVVAQQNRRPPGGGLASGLIIRTMGATQFADLLTEFREAL
jgi:hypothetical protein